MYSRRSRKTLPDPSVLLGHQPFESDAGLEAMMTTNYPELKLFIGGEWVAGGGRVTQPVLNPATEEVLGTLPHASKADLDRALDAAQRSFPAWRAKPPHERGKILRRAA